MKQLNSLCALDRMSPPQSEVDSLALLKLTRPVSLLSLAEGQQEIRQHELENFLQPPGRRAITWSLRPVAGGGGRAEAPARGQRNAEADFSWRPLRKPSRPLRLIRAGAGLL